MRWSAARTRLTYLLCRPVLRVVCGPAATDLPQAMLLRMAHREPRSWSRSALDSASGLRRRPIRYVRPRLLVVDEVGYLSYGNRHADLPFEVVTRRYAEGHKPILITTTKPFRRVVRGLPQRHLRRHPGPPVRDVRIDGESFRLKEAKDRAAERTKKRGRRSVR